ncbi:MAG: YhgE/Pip domain-containing protein, partial [Propionicimonas sp.]
MNPEHLNSTPARWYTLLGLLLVPLLVAGGFLLAGVNADARMHTVKAAIVNLDEPVTIKGQYTPLGRQLTANLVDSTRQENLTWVLDTEANARAGLTTGTYAAMVVIPKNFSAAATSFAKDADQAEQATIDVETSPVAGVADATLGRLVASEAAVTLNQTLTEGYLKQIYIGFNDLGKQFTTLADGS